MNPFIKICLAQFLMSPVGQRDFISDWPTVVSSGQVERAAATACHCEYAHLTDTWRKSQRQVGAYAYLFMCVTGRARNSHGSASLLPAAVIDVESVKRGGTCLPAACHKSHVMGVVRKEARRAMKRSFWPRCVKGL